MEYGSQSALGKFQWLRVKYVWLRVVACVACCVWLRGAACGAQGCVPVLDVAYVGCNRCRTSSIASRTNRDDVSIESSCRFPDRLIIV